MFWVKYLIIWSRFEAYRHNALAQKKEFCQFLTFKKEFVLLVRMKVRMMQSCLRKIRRNLVHFYGREYDRSKELENDLSSLYCLDGR